MSPKINQIKKNVIAACAGTSTALMMMPVTGVMADVYATGETAKQISNIQSGLGSTAESVVEDFEKVLSVILMAIGILLIVKSIADWMFAKQEDNSVNESHAYRMLIFGIVLFGAPFIITFMLNGHF